MASTQQIPSPTDHENENENDHSPRDQSAESSRPPSRDGSRTLKKRYNVRFTAGGESLDSANQRAPFDLRDDTNAPPKPKPLARTRPESSSLRTRSHTLVRRFGNEKSADITDEPVRAPVPKARPSIMRLPSSDSNIGGNASQDDSEVDLEGTKDAIYKDDEQEDYEDAPAKALSQKSAQNRAERLSRMMGSHSAPGSRYTSPHRPHGFVVRSPPPSPPPDDEGAMPIDLNDLPLKKLESKRTKYGIEDESEEEEEAAPKRQPSKAQNPNPFHRAAARLFGRHTRGEHLEISMARVESPQSGSGAQTPVYERDPDHYVPKPTEYKDGYLSSLLKLVDQHSSRSGASFMHLGPEGGIRIGRGSTSDLPLLPISRKERSTTPRQTPDTTPGGSPTSSGTTTPKQKHQKWYYKTSAHNSTGALSDLVNSSTVFAQPGSAKQTSVVRPKPKHRPLSHQAMDAVLGKKDKGEGDDAVNIRIHIAEIMQTHTFLLKMCRALMSYGAPTHRLEEYMTMCSRALGIEGQFLYIPNCMVISFDDRETHTTEVKLVREDQRVNLGKLRDTHEIYKEVIHDVIDLEEAMQRLDEVTNSNNKYRPWVIVLFYGFASVCVGPFAFGARPIDLPLAFLLGCILGILQHIVAPKSVLYSNIFEVSAAVITSFLARFFGSLYGGRLFCFSALTQSAIALILPGYTVLCGSLELQSRSMVAGSVRMVYAIIYSLFLGFGITIGTSFYGGIDPNATSDTSCRTAMPVWFKFIFVPPFTFCLIVINQGKWKQMPVMMIIAFIGFIVNYYSALHFPTNVQIANTLGALAIGVLGNLYSRLHHGLAAAALLPAIYVQVPSGLAASGSLVSGITSANQITNKTGDAIGANGTTTVSSAVNQGGDVNSMVFNVGYSMIQVAIGLTVGLFLSALVIYPFGKRRSGLFSF